jgi:DNA invertase Pin-like site-specific DNA recombinase
MSGRPSAATEKALKLVKGGSTAYAAAKKTGIALSTIYRALKRSKAHEPRRS